MLTQGFFYLADKSPAVRRLIVRILFEYLARYYYGLISWTQMNYGYASDGGNGHTIPLDAVQESERYCHQLYHHLTLGLDLAGMDVLEVSSGRGGGAVFLHRLCNTRTMTGVDIAHAAVAFCNRTHAAPGLRFVQGDAEALPLPSESFDAVVNVEASFCYASTDRFLAEVYRVLRPGGYFLYTDLRLTREVAALRDALARSRLDLMSENNITANVVRALQLDAARRAGLDGQGVSRWLRHAMRTFAGAPGTRIPTLLARDDMRYLSFVLRKLGAAAPIPAADAKRNAESSTVPSYDGPEIALAGSKAFAT